MFEWTVPATDAGYHGMKQNGEPERLARAWTCTSNEAALIAQFYLCRNNAYGSIWDRCSLKNHWNRYSFGMRKNLFLRILFCILKQNRITVLPEPQHIMLRLRSFSGGDANWQKSKMWRLQPMKLQTNWKYPMMLVLLPRQKIIIPTYDRLADYIACLYNGFWWTTFFDDKNAYSV